jgi:WD40 repeat protein
MQQEDHEGDISDEESEDIPKNEKSFDLKIIAGTYDSTLCGWEVTVATKLDFEHILDHYVLEENEDEQMQQDEDAEAKETEMEGVEFRELFAVKSHSGSINSVTVFGQWMATGGYDENIVVYDVKKSKEEAVIHHMEGAITHLELFEKFLFASTTHGVVSIHQFSRNWEKIWQEQAHKNGGCKGFAIHPSGRFMITVGENDHKLKLWNLINGQQAYSINMGGSSQVCDMIRFSPSGDSFCVVSRDKFYVYDTETVQRVCTLTIRKEEDKKKFAPHLRITCCKYLSEVLLCTGYDDKNAYIWDLRKQEVLHTLSIHTNRVKDVDMMEINVGEFVVTTVDSDGGLALWKIADEFALLEGFVNTGARLTTVAIVKPKSVSEFVRSRYKMFKKQFLKNSTE